MRSIAELEFEADPAAYPGRLEEYCPSSDDIYQLLKEVEYWTFVENDPTWGYYVLVTAYTVDAQNKLSQVMASWVEVVQKSLSLGPLPIYSEDAFRHFKFMVLWMAPLLLAFVKSSEPRSRVYALMRRVIILMILLKH